MLVIKRCAKDFTGQRCESEIVSSATAAPVMSSSAAGYLWMPLSISVIVCICLGLTGLGCYCSRTGFVIEINDLLPGSSRSI